VAREHHLIRYSVCVLINTSCSVCLTRLITDRPHLFLLFNLALVRDATAFYWFGVFYRIEEREREQGGEKRRGGQRKSVMHRNMQVRKHFSIKGSHSSHKSESCLQRTVSLQQKL